MLRRLCLTVSAGCLLSACVAWAQTTPQSEIKERKVLAKLLGSSDDEKADAG